MPKMPATAAHDRRTVGGLRSVAETLGCERERREEERERLKRESELQRKAAERAKRLELLVRLVGTLQRRKASHKKHRSCCFVAAG